MWGLILIVYLVGALLMSGLMTFYHILMMGKGEPVWKLVFTAVIWPAVLISLTISWIRGEKL